VESNKNNDNRKSKDPDQDKTFDIWDLLIQNAVIGRFSARVGILTLARFCARRCGRDAPIWSDDLRKRQEGDSYWDCRHDELSELWLVASRYGSHSRAIPNKRGVIGTSMPNFPKIDL
jgi:hypothetical protein